MELALLLLVVVVAVVVCVSVCQSGIFNLLFIQWVRGQWPWGYGSVLSII